MVAGADPSITSSSGQTKGRGKGGRGVERNNEDTREGNVGGISRDHAR
jgi:hypothetical protein